MHLKKFLLILLWSLTSFKSSYAQNDYSIHGKVVDSLAVPISGANITLFFGHDSLKTISDENGHFAINGVGEMPMHLTISYLGFTNFSVKCTSATALQNLLLNPIKLKTYFKKLKEVLVKEKIRPIVFKIDTVEYNISSFSYNEQDMIADLLKQLPGLKIQSNGTLTYEGQPVPKLRVNGEDFFTGDVREFITQLPVLLFSKVQIINDYGDQAAFTGVKDKVSSKLLNLTTKPGKDNGIFGSVNTSVGTNKRFGLGLSDNYWNKSKQLSSLVDLTAARDINNGLGFKNKFTLNYNDRLNKTFKIFSVYNYTNNKTSVQNKSYSETVNSIGLIHNSINGNSSLQNGANSFTLNIKTDKTSKTLVKIDLSLSLNKSRDSSVFNTQQSGIIQQRALTNRTGHVRNPQGGLSLTFGQKFNRGAVLAVNFQYKVNRSVNEIRLNNKISYYDQTSASRKDSLLKQLISTKNNVTNTNINLTYSEPINKNSTFDLVYDFSLSQQKKHSGTSLYLTPIKLISVDSLSGDLTNVVLSNKININYRYNNQLLTIRGGVSIQRDALTGEYIGRLSSTQNVQSNFFPILNIIYNASPVSNFELKYLGSSQQPTVEELTPVQDVRDFQNTIIGNPDLKPSFNHQIELNFHHYATKTGQSLYANLTGAIIQNQIVTNTMLKTDTLNTLKQITSFKNVSGTKTLAANYNWSVPFRLLNTQFKTELFGTLKFYKEPLLTDNKPSYNLNNAVSQGIKTNGNFKYFDVDASITYTLLHNHYTTGDGLINNVKQLELSLNQIFIIKKDTRITIEGTKSFIKGYTSIASNNPFVVNITYVQSFIENKLNLRLMATDLFNQYNKLTQITNGNTIVNNQENYITRYFIVNLNFRFSKFGIFK